MRFCRIIIAASILSSSLTNCSLEENNDLSQLLPLACDEVNEETENSLDFFVLSDWGYNGSDNQLRVAAEMENVARIVRPEFVLTCGDNFQLTGVKSTSDLQWGLNFEDVYTDRSLLIPWYAALGNHDYEGNPDAEVAYSNLNDYWKMPSRYYSFVEPVDSFTTVRFIVLDTEALISEYRNLPDPGNYSTLAQYSWLVNLLPQVKEDWIVVVGHHPVYSANLYHGDSKEINIMIKPLLDHYKVDFYLCGHDHNFEHAREEGKTTDYFVNGTGGTLRACSSNERTVFSLSKLGYTYISISRRMASVRFITDEGRMAYNYNRFK